MWAVSYTDKDCIDAVACSLDELKALLEGGAKSQDEAQKQTCLAAGSNDFEMAIDHKYPTPVGVTPANRTVILYGQISSPSFLPFHEELEEAAKENHVQYIVRHFADDATQDTLLQGYGVSLDIKDMEYKTIDDSKTSSGGAEIVSLHDELEIDEEALEELAEEEDVNGLYYKRLMMSYRKISQDIVEFRDLVVTTTETEEDAEVKAWHLQDLGLTAARKIIADANPLRMLQKLSQDFPIHAKKLAFSRKAIPQEFRDEVDRRREEVEASGLKDKLVVNGIVVDPMQRSFNVFDFLNTLQAEWSVSRKLAALPVPDSDLVELLKQVQESSGAKPAARIRVRGAMSGSAPFYLNDIDTDAVTKQWSTDVNVLKRPAWNLIFLRKNMYEYVVVFDPTNTVGRNAINQMNFLRARGAPLQFGLVISSAELLASESKAEQDALIAGWKTLEVTAEATAWHFAKLLFLARSKDSEQDAASSDSEETTNVLKSGRITAAFVEGIAHIDDPTLSIQNILDAYVDAAIGDSKRSVVEEEALLVLQGDSFDEEVMSMTEFIQNKHLQLESSILNGVVKDVDLQNEIMMHLGRDQSLYQEMARNDLLDTDSDLIEELLASQETYPGYFSMFNDKAADKPEHLLARDIEGKLEELLQSRVIYLHSPESIASTKKQTLMFVANLSDPQQAAHVYHGVKAVLEDSEKSVRVGLIHRFGDEEQLQPTGTVGELVASLTDIVGHSDKETHLKIVLEALQCIAKGKTLEAMQSKLIGIWKKLGEGDDSEIAASITKALGTKQKSKWRTGKRRREVKQLLRALSVSSTTDIGARLYINGQPIDLPSKSITEEDMHALLSYDLKHRSEDIAKAFIKKSVKLDETEAHQQSFDIIKVCGVIDQYKQTDRRAPFDLGESELVIRQYGETPLLQVSAYVDPLSEAAQRMSSLLIMLHRQLGASIELVLAPSSNYAEFPLERFYRYLFDKKMTVKSGRVEFKKLPITPILTMKIDTPEPWNVQVRSTADDLDNLRVDPDNAADVNAVKTAEFKVESLLVYGQCRDKTFDRYSPPNGLQLVLDRELRGAHLHRDTLVMKNLGYFQLQAAPGIWSLHLARGRATELYEIVDAEAGDAAVESVDVQVNDFSSHIFQLLVRKRDGKEQENLLEVGSHLTKDDIEPIAEDAGVLGSYWSSFKSLIGTKKTVTIPSKKKKDDESKSAVTTQERTGETIHVFSLATGHLYERFLKIMMSSVLKRTNNPVTFWLLENFLSPAFKESIPALRAEFGMDIRLVTYKWPDWLRQQTQKQRIIWGYKILFLDVLFPLGVQKVIYVDADQVVRADLKELWDMDLQGAPYGYTPFCETRNVGYQFWRQGYWKDHLRGKPYHISALYVVDLALFRQMAAGDTLRAVYEQLSADPNSLSNLDQDLPNYVQHQLKIFSLPKEWLWCESWCNDESKEAAKTIDLCNNPKHKEAKLDMAKRVISGELFPESWVELDQEIKDAEERFVKQQQ